MPIAKMKRLQVLALERDHDALLRQLERMGCVEISEPDAPDAPESLRRCDSETADCLAIILRDEVGHVAIGNHWYRWLCQRDGLDPVQTYDRLAREHHAPRLRGPLNIEARPAAGFTHGEVDALL